MAIPIRLPRLVTSERPSLGCHERRGDDRAHSRRARVQGPVSRYLGPEVSSEQLIWQDPVPVVDHPLVDEADMATLKGRILPSGLSISELVTRPAQVSTRRAP
jgi:catalase (peroxidase I)